MKKKIEVSFCGNKGYCTVCNQPLEGAYCPYCGTEYEDVQREIREIIQYHDIKFVVDVPDPDLLFNKVIELVEELGGTCCGHLKEGEWEYINEKDL